MCTSLAFRADLDIALTLRFPTGEEVGDGPYLNSKIQMTFDATSKTHDEKYCGHFLLRRVDFTPQRLSIELDRPRDNFVSMTFVMVATEFAEASQVVKIISGEIEPP